MREISFKAIKNMEGQKVLVRDIEYGGPNQICTIKINYAVPSNNRLLLNKKIKDVIENIELIGEECTFKYTSWGTCVNGEFKVYTLN